MRKSISFMLSARVFSLVILLMLSSCAYYNTLFNAKKHYNSGLKSMQNNSDRNNIPPDARKDFETTIEKCWKLIEIYSDENGYADDALLYIAKSEYQLAKYLNSKNHLEQFQQKYPKSNLLPEANLWYAKTLLKEEQIDEANEYFKQVIANSDRAQLRSEASFELGRFAFENGNYQESIERLNTALNEKIDDEYKALLLFYLGESFFIQNQFDEAIEQYKKVADYKPTLDVEYRSGLNLAKAYTNRKEYDKAYQGLRKMLTAPRFRNFAANIKTAMANNYYAEGKRDDALDLYKEVVLDRRSNTGTAEAAFTLGKIYENDLNNLDSAVVYFGKVRSLYSRYDSVDVAVEKEQFLKDYKVIRTQLQTDERLVYRLTNDTVFRDSLYQAQYDDSLRTALGLPSLTETETDSLDSLGYTPLQLDSLRSVVGSDSVDRYIERKTSEWQVIKKLMAKGYRVTQLPQEFDQVNILTAQGYEIDRLIEEFEVRFIEEQERIADKGPEDDNGKEDDEDDDETSDDNKITKIDEEEEAKKKEKPLEKRKLPQIEFDLMKSRYQLAEFYLLKVEAYDSAQFHYQRFLNTYEDSVLTPKALYSLRYIYTLDGKEHEDNIQALEDQLLREFPQSPFAAEILTAKGLNRPTEDSDTTITQLSREFLNAEQAYLRGDIDKAVSTYEMIASADTALEISAKAMYAMAWIYEKDLGQPEQALEAYQNIISRYPTATDYVTMARRKTTPIVEQAVTTDSSAVAGDQIADNDSDVDDSNIIKFDNILDEKIRWRIARDPASFR